MHLYVESYFDSAWHVHVHAYLAGHSPLLHDSCNYLDPYKLNEDEEAKEYNLIHLATVSDVSDTEFAMILESVIKHNRW